MGSDLEKTPGKRPGAMALAVCFAFVLNAPIASSEPIGDSETVEALYNVLGQTLGALQGPRDVAASCADANVTACWQTLNQTRADIATAFECFEDQVLDPTPNIKEALDCLILGGGYLCLDFQVTGRDIVLNAIPGQFQILPYEDKVVVKGIYGNKLHAVLPNETPRLTLGATGIGALTISQSITSGGRCN